MLKLLGFTLLLANSFAQDKPKTWDQMIAAGDGAKLATTLQLNDAYNKRHEQDSKDANEKNEDVSSVGGFEFLPDNSDEITNLDLLNKFEFFHYYKDGSKSYLDAAIEAVKGRSPAAAVDNEKYKSFREFLIYGQKNPRLKDLLPDLLVNDEATDPALMKALLQDPNPELRAAFARSYWRSMASFTDETENFYKTTKLFLENTNKDDLIEAFKNFDNKGYLSDEFRYCSPQFWLAGRLLMGEQKNKKFGEIIEKKIAENDDELNECKDAKVLRDLSDADYQKLTSDSVYQKNFWAKMNLESSKMNDVDEKITEAGKQKQKDEERKVLQQIINLLVKKEGAKTAPPSKVQQ